MDPRQSVFPFIVGCGRSGTTLVRALFDSHPQMAVPHESYFVESLARRRARYERPSGFDTRRFAADLLAHPWFHRWALPADEVSSALFRQQPAGYPDAVRVVYALYAHHHGKSRYADKTPNYVLHIPLLAELFPEARFLHLVRDGRDVALSLLEQEWGADSVAAAALYWNRRTQAGRRAGQTLGPERYREVRYEDLIEEPEAVLRPLCPFLGLSFEPEMLHYAERAEELIRPAAFPDQHQRLRLPPTKGLRDWRSQMAPKDVATFEALSGRLLEELRYERAVLQIPVRLRFEAMIRGTGAGFRRRARDVRRRSSRLARRIL